MVIVVVVFEFDSVAPPSFSISPLSFSLWPRFRSTYERELLLAPHLNIDISH
jgi:hypothetical protein